MQNFHNHKWTMYVAIVLLTVVMGWFIISFITNVSVDKNKEKQQAIEVAKDEANEKIDSIAEVIEVAKTNQNARVESLAKRVEAVKVNATIEKSVLHKQYEELFKQVECYSDDSIGNIYNQYRNRAKYDTLLSK